MATMRTMRTRKMKMWYILKYPNSFTKLRADFTNSPNEESGVVLPIHSLTMKPRSKRVKRKMKRKRKKKRDSLLIQELTTFENFEKNTAIVN
jgi:hypothetical protein